MFFRWTGQGAEKNLHQMGQQASNQGTCHQAGSTMCEQMPCLSSPPPVIRKTSEVIYETWAWHTGSGRPDEECWLFFNHMMLGEGLVWPNNSGGGRPFVRSMNVTPYQLTLPEPPPAGNIGHRPMAAAGTGGIMFLIPHVSLSLLKFLFKKINKYEKSEFLNTCVEHLFE